jgi:translocator protein
MTITEERVGKWDWRIALITVPALIGFGSFSSWLAGSRYASPWFASLSKPFFMPPEWLFGFVWPVLYALLGIALALILKERQTRRRHNALLLFFAQLILTYAWAPIFFGTHDIQSALIAILVATAMAAIAAGQFLRIRPLAGYLMVPHLAWLCFMAALTNTIARLNPGAGTSLLG